MTPTEALARIAAHCDELETDAHPGRLIAQVRAVLAAVTLETGGTLDRDQARAAITHWYGSKPPELDSPRGLLNALAGCVRPVAGVTLTPEEAEWAAFALRKVAPDFGAPFQRDVAEKLAARLEATQ